MKWAFTAEINGTPGGEWALVQVGEQANTVRAFGTQEQAVAALVATAAAEPSETFTAPISSAASATWALVWSGSKPGQNYVLGCLTNHDSLLAMADLVERHARHPTAAEDAAKLRRAAMELVN
ncbi:MAG TPA: hypothetical protein VEQ10_10295 [Vicinamibacteria bacterium]|nr:hypothetical protein [Vicinamibacteria bacterium]